MSISPRAALLAAPALIALAGAVLIVRDPHWVKGSSSADTFAFAGDNVIEPSVADSDFERMVYEKQRATMDLLAGRCTLTEAADRFRELSRSVPYVAENMETAWHGRTEWERALQQAVAFARAFARRYPGRFDAAMAEIEAEAAALLEAETPLQ